MHTIDPMLYASEEKAYGRYPSRIEPAAEYRFTAMIETHQRILRAAG